jgi:hypothetical protein
MCGGGGADRSTRLTFHSVDLDDDVTEHNVPPSVLIRFFKHGLCLARNNAVNESALDTKPCKNPVRREDQSESGRQWASVSVVSCCVVLVDIRRDGSIHMDTG